MYNRFIICMYSVIESILFVIKLDNNIINIKCKYICINVRILASLVLDFRVFIILFNNIYE